jgi:hypothetical protein
LFCEPTLNVETEDLRACFGWDGTSWGPNTPQEVVDSCPNPDIIGDVCVIPYLAESPSCDNYCGDCYPLDGGDGGINGDPDPDCCQCDMVYAGLEALEAALDACGFVGYIPLNNCSDPEWILKTEDECDDGESFARAPGANVIMYVDPLSSYITINTPLDSETFAVAGGGTAKTSVDKFMTATVWPADGSIAGYATADWVFWTTAPIDYDPVSGNFTVQYETAPAFVGRGSIDGDAYTREVQMANDATGNLNASAHTWQADYTQSLLGHSIQVHLQGTWASLP